LGGDDLNFVKEGVEIYHMATMSSLDLPTFHLLLPIYSLWSFQANKNPSSPSVIVFQVVRGVVVVVLAVVGVLARHAPVDVPVSALLLVVVWMNGLNVVPGCQEMRRADAGRSGEHAVAAGDEALEHVVLDGELVHALLQLDYALELLQPALAGRYPVPLPLATKKNRKLKEKNVCLEQ
jgi:hypothetical protein